MGTYLTKLKSTLNQVQARQITNLLLKKKERGEIHNLEEFRTQLEELTNKLLSNTITPSFQLFIGQLDQVIDSNTFNFMLERINDDLEALFEEANTISEVLEAHQNIIGNVVLKTIRQGLEDLDSKISVYEFLSSNIHGFDNAQFNTFRSGEELRTFRSSKDSAILFRDKKANDSVDIDSNVDPLGERLTLGADVVEYISVNNVEQVFDIESTQSEIIVSFPSSNINNILDGSKHTYWLYSVLQRQIHPTGILAKLAFTLPSFREVNFLEIESASPYPMFVVRLEYRDSNNDTQIIAINETLSGSKKLHFPIILTDRITLVIRQKNGLELQYKDKAVTDNFDAALLGQDVDVDVVSISEEIREIIRSSFLIEEIFNLQEDNKETRKLFDYTIGFDNIRMGFASYTTNSIFVSSPLKVDSLSQLALKVVEQVPIDDNGFEYVATNTEDKYGLGSIEYYAAVYNYDINDGLIDINTVPIFPIGKERVYQERLLLTVEVGSTIIFNAGYLMFYPDITEDINVYRNGTLLSETGWSIVDELSNDVAPPNGKPNITCIRIATPSETDYYTISYTPLLSNTRGHPIDIYGASPGTVTSVDSHVIDLVGDGTVRMGPSNILIFTPDKIRTVEYSKVYLVVIFRRNSPNEELTPLLDEYLLLTSSRDLAKFNG